MKRTSEAKKSSEKKTMTPKSKEVADPTASVPDFHWRRLIDGAITKLQETLLQPVSEEHLDRCCNLIQPLHFAMIQEERAAAFLCAYPTCSNKLPEKRPKQKYVFSGSLLKVFDAHELHDFCSERCLVNSKLLISKLSTEPVYGRPDAEALLCSIFPSMDKERLDQLRIKQAQSKPSPVSLIIHEKEPTEAPVPPSLEYAETSPIYEPPPKKSKFKPQTSPKSTETTSLQKSESKKRTLAAKSDEAPSSISTSMSIVTEKQQEKSSSSSNTNIKTSSFLQKSRTTKILEDGIDEDSGIPSLPILSYDTNPENLPFEEMHISPQPESQTFSKATKTSQSKTSEDSMEIDKKKGVSFSSKNQVRNIAPRRTTMTLPEEEEETHTATNNVNVENAENSEGSEEDEGPLDYGIANEVREESSEESSSSDDESSDGSDGDVSLDQSGSDAEEGEGSKSGGGGSSSGGTRSKQKGFTLSPFGRLWTQISDWITEDTLSFFNTLSRGEKYDERAILGTFLSADEQIEYVFRKEKRSVNAALIETNIKKSLASVFSASPDLIAHCSDLISTFDTQHTSAFEETEWIIVTLVLVQGLFEVCPALAIEDHKQAAQKAATQANEETSVDQDKMKELVRTLKQGCA